MKLPNIKLYEMLPMRDLYCIYISKTVLVIRHKMHFPYFTHQKVYENTSPPTHLSHFNSLCANHVNERINALMLMFIICV